MHWHNLWTTVRTNLQLHNVQSLASLSYWYGYRGNIRAALFQFMQTIFDTIIFVLIICKALSAVLATKRAGRGGPLFKENSVMAVIASQGVAYYGYVRNVKLTVTWLRRVCTRTDVFFVRVIFTANFVWAMMIIFAPVRGIFSHSIHSTSVAESESRKVWNTPRRSKYLIFPVLNG